MNFTKTYYEKFDETLYFATHNSGLRVYVMPKQGYSKCYAVIGTQFGSIDSVFTVAGEDEQTILPDGIAHFLEHKMFEQPDGGNVFGEFAKFGANANAFTSFNMTAYLYECTEAPIENLKILLDYISKPYFTDENIEKEQGIIGQEIKMYDDDPEWKCAINMLSAMYKNHPIKNDIAGSVESIAKINKELLYKCYDNFYNMANMILFVIGDIDVQSVGDCVDTMIKDYKILDNLPARDYGTEPATVNENTTCENMDVSVTSFMLGYKDTDTGYNGAKLLKKATEYSIILELAFGKTSDIYNELVEKGLIMGFLDFDAECEPSYGHITISGESNEPEKVREVVFKGIEKLKKSGIKKVDIDRLKKAYHGRFIKQFDHISSVAHAFLSNTFNNIGMFEYVDVIKSVTEEDINKRLRENFDENLSVLSIIKPKRQ